jgi:hypothetical protein
MAQKITINLSLHAPRIRIRKWTHSSTHSWPQHWCVSRMCRFMPGTSTVDTQRTEGWAGTRGGLDTLEKRNIVFPCRESNGDSSVVQRTAWPTTCVMNNRHNVLHSRTRQRVSFPAAVINTMPLLRYSTTLSNHCAKNIVCSGLSLISSQLMPMNTLRSTRSCRTWDVPFHIELLVGKVALEYVLSRNIAGTHHLTDVLETY